MPCLLRIESADALSLQLVIDAYLLARLCEQVLAKLDFGLKEREKN